MPIPSNADLFTLEILRSRISDGSWSVESVLAETCRRIDAAADQHPNVWISRASPTEIQAQILVVEELHRKGNRLPLRGVPVAIKDNIDVGGIPTTAACPGFAFMPSRSAACVQRLTDAGAIIVGKTNLDQFATGLVGVRSPHGACRSALNADYISGGSSSGSAVAVASGMVPIALGTDTAGSGRIPAAFNNIIGLKPTRGLVSTSGVVPACRSLDCVSVFALTVDDAETVLDVISGYDASDPYSRQPTSIGIPSPAFSGRFRFGRPTDEMLQFFGNGEYRALFQKAVEALKRLGGEEVVIDFAPFSETARLLYGPWIAERLAGLRDFWEHNRDSILPITREILAAGEKVNGVSAFQVLHKLAEFRRATEQQWPAMDVMVLPTAGTMYTLEQVAVDPIGANTNMGYYTNFANLLDLCALAVPAGFTSSGLPFGISFFAPAGGEGPINSIGRRFETAMNLPLGATNQHRLSADAAPARSLPEPFPATARLAVVGAHLSGLPLNHQLTKAGGRLVWSGKTSPSYRLFALPNTSPPKPGMIRDSQQQRVGIELEVWELPVRSFGEFVAAIPPPLGIGSIELENGSWVQGFLCESHVLSGAEEITHFGGWRTFIVARR